MNDETTRTADDPPLVIAGHRIDVLEGAFSWYIRSLDSFVSRDLDERMAHLPVARGKGKVTALLLIDDYPGIRPSEIAEVLMRDRPSTGRIIDTLVSAGLAHRDISADDQRAHALSITDAGHAVAEQVRAVVRQQEAEFFDFIAPEDRAQFLSILKRTYMRMRQKWQ
ncbi:MarR family winged helix-turn-helix transcriptional regulator [Paenirhodobacter populi]|uniref:MarR family winged helix-turn-helix transcriptional regulator n=1 Tax=Paenirhodobacter populi TaxID=2306993 RepID=UPI000FE307FD|nr:MarR family transcriptional regulator [Sinirhodobacter populi]RWR09057.1 MarR family transcriptional regulator [Sinirhodobacter populi]